MRELRAETATDRLLQLSEEVSRIAASLANVSLNFVEPAPSKGRIEGDMLEVSQLDVQWLIKARRERSRYLTGDLFCDPVWDILLDLLRAELAQQRVSVSSLCIASGVPPTTALRYLKMMVKRQILIRHADPRDGRRVFIELSPETSRSLRQYFVDVIEGIKPDCNRARGLRERDFDS